MLLPLVRHCGDCQTPGKRRISNDAGRVKSVFSSFLRNSSTLLLRRTNCVSFGRFCSSVSTLTCPAVYVHQFSVAHQTSLRSPSTMMSYSNSLFFEGGG